MVRYAGGMTLLVVYGYHVKATEDVFLELADECVALLSNDIASSGSIWPVDIIPSCALSSACSDPIFTSLTCVMSSEAFTGLVSWCRLQAEGSHLEEKDGGVRRQAVRVCFG